LEAITWIPDYDLRNNFVDDVGEPYVPEDYPGHGDGLFVVGLEATGQLFIVALINNANRDAYVLAEIASGHLNVMSLEYDHKNKLLWAGCDDTCDNQTSVLEMDEEGNFRVTGLFSRPGKLRNKNNEGIALMDECDDSSRTREFFWTFNERKIYRGSIDCTMSY
jgi:hypothetical protein